VKWVRVLGMQVTLHDRRIVMQVTLHYEEDWQLFVQFCSNDPDTLLKVAKRVEAYCDYVDINLRRIVMQVTLHYEVIVMQVTLHDKRIVMQATLHYEEIVMQVTLHDRRIVMQVTLHYERMDVIFIGQCKYAQEMFENFNMDQCNPVHNPAVPGLKLTKDEEGTKVDGTIYMQMTSKSVYDDVVIYTHLEDWQLFV
nr:uncharacterized mitochondrial protein AtMg00810-like [Tanacetum cinerariifolium]